MKEIGEHATFSSGAKRSKAKFPYWKLPKVALEAWTSRLRKGELNGYEDRDPATGARGTVHNWKKAIRTNDVEYVQQMFNHAFDHLFDMKELASVGWNAIDDEGETMYDHLGAVMWNVAGLIVYLVKDPLLFCNALNQEPHLAQWERIERSEPWRQEMTAGFHPLPMTDEMAGDMTIQLPNLKEVHLNSTIRRKKNKRDRRRGK